MVTKAMQITLSTIHADPRWGENALLSADKNGMIIHLTGVDALSGIQSAAREIERQGIKEVTSVGEQWNLGHCWAFWQGYRAPKKAIVT